MFLLIDYVVVIWLSDVQRCRMVYTNCRIFTGCGNLSLHSACHLLILRCQLVLLIGWSMIRHPCTYA